MIEENRLQVFENTELSTTFSAKWEEVVGSCKKKNT
jgi:hypothetical protein